MSVPAHMESTTTWAGGATFEHVAGSEVVYRTDALLEGESPRPRRGPTPMELLLGALAGCSGVDIISILRKMRLELRALRILVNAERKSEHPRVFRRIHVTYEIETDPVDLIKVQRAVELSSRKYCSVSATLETLAEMTYTLRYAGGEYPGGSPRAAPIEDALDLHAFAPQDIGTVVEEYIWEAARQGLREVRIIHGKGIGVQRESVTAVLARHPAVASHAPAPADRGHWGATVVRLREGVARD